MHSSWGTSLTKTETAVLLGIEVIQAGGQLGHQFVLVKLHLRIAKCWGCSLRSRLEVGQGGHYRLVMQTLLQTFPCTLVA